MLTNEELAIAYQAGNNDALDILIERNMNLIRHFAPAYTSTKYSYEDICQNGVIGLIQAIKRFDPTKGAKLSSYASLWIIKSIREGWSDYDWRISVIYKIKREHPDFTELQVYQYLRKNVPFAKGLKWNNFISLSQVKSFIPLTHSDEDNDWDYLEAPDYHHQYEVEHDLNNIIRSCPPRLKRIFKCFVKGMTIQETCKHLNISSMSIYIDFERHFGRPFNKSFKRNK